MQTFSGSSWNIIRDASGPGRQEPSDNFFGQSAQRSSRRHLSNRSLISCVKSYTCSCNMKWNLGLWLVPSPLVVRVDVSANSSGKELGGLCVVKLLPSAGVTDEWDDPCAELRVVRKRCDGLVLVELVLLRDRKEVEPNPDLTGALDTQVAFDVLQPAQLCPLFVVRMIFRLPVVRYEVGRRAAGHLSVEL